jgi:hypothetical protein
MKTAFLIAATLAAMAAPASAHPIDPKVKARIDPARRLWYGEMRIPFAAIESGPVRPGLELRAGFFRISGVEPQRGYLSWHTTDGRTFHVPERFGILRLGPDQ